MKPKVVVIGAGISGLSTAYLLQKKGFNVTVIEGKPSVAQVASLANGSQLSFSHLQPIYFKERPKFSLFTKKTTYQNCLNYGSSVTKTLIKQQAEAKHHHDKNLKTLINISNISKNVLDEFIQNERINKHIKPCGIIHLFSSYAEVQKELEVAKLYNMPFKMIEKDQFLDYEPNLEYFNGNFKYGVFYKEDKTSNCHDICKILEEKLKQEGVSFLFNSYVQNLNVKDGKICSATLKNKDKITGDFFVCANGVSIPSLVEDIACDYPIFPVRGYSLTFSRNRGDYFPFLGLIDRKRKMVYSTYKDYLRIAGFFDVGVEKKQDIAFRLEDFKKTVFEVFPMLKGNAIVHQWTENRHFTPSSVPIVGKSGLFKNLFINGGHGALGFTLSFGAAKIISELI